MRFFRFLYATLHVRNVRTAPTMQMTYTTSLEMVNAQYDMTKRPSRPSISWQVSTSCQWKMPSWRPCQGAWPSLCFQTPSAGKRRTIILTFTHFVVYENRQQVFYEDLSLRNGK